MAPGVRNAQSFLSGDSAGKKAPCATPELEDNEEAPVARSQGDARFITFVIEGQEFVLPKPFLSIHSPHWKQRFAEQPDLVRLELTGEADSFQTFAEFLQGTEGPNTEVTNDNVLHLLRWGKEFGVDYVASFCEDFLLSRPPSNIQPAEMLEIAARYGMPLLYSQATEVCAQGMHHIKVPEHGEAPLPAPFASAGIRDDIVEAHISMGLMRGDGEMRRRHRFADHTTLDDTRQRARLLWKTRKRFVPTSAAPPEHDWKSLQTVWPHHSLRGDDWLVVPCETQPTMPLRDVGASLR